MKEARLADGTTLRFPDDTPDDVMDRAVQEHIATNRTPAERRLAQGREMNSSLPGAIGAGVRALGQGLTLGHYDELQAGLEGGINAITGGRIGRPHSQALEQGRAQDAALQADNPLTSLALNATGGLATPIPGAGPARAGASALQRMVRSAPARGTVAGGIAGGVTGAGEAENSGDIVAKALMGAGFGGAVGGGFGAGVMLGVPAFRAIGSALNLTNPETAAERLALRALDRGQPGLAPGASAVQAPAGRLMNPPEGAPLAMADVGGRPTVNLAATAANTPSEAMEIADRFVANRRDARPERIAGMVDSTLGGGGGTRVLNDMDALRQTRSQNASPLYDQAFAAQAPDTPAVHRIMALPEVRQAVDESMRFQQMQAAARGEAFDPNPMQVLDATKRALDERVSATLDSVTGRVIPGRGQENIAYSELRDALVRELDTVPEYAAARAEWAGPSAAMDAMRVGQAALRMNPDQLDLAVRQMGGPAELEAARIGLGRAITDATDDPGTAVGAARRLAEDRGNQRRIETLQPNPTESNRLLNALRTEAQMGGVEQAVSPRAGSQTARLLAGGEDMANIPSGPIAAALTGNFGQAVAGLARAGQGINASTSDALARILLENDPAAARAIVERLIARESRDAQGRAFWADVLQRGTQASGVGTAQALDR